MFLGHALFHWDEDTIVRKNEEWTMVGFGTCLNKSTPGLDQVQLALSILELELQLLHPGLVLILNPFDCRWSCASGRAE